MHIHFFICIRVLILSSFEMYALTEDLLMLSSGHSLISSIHQMPQSQVEGSHGRICQQGKELLAPVKLWFLSLVYLPVLSFLYVTPIIIARKAVNVLQPKYQAAKLFCYLPLPSPPQLLGCYASIISSKSLFC